MPALSPEEIGSHLREQLATQLAADSLFGTPQVAELPDSRRIAANAFLEDSVMAVELAYGLGQDLRYVRVSASVSLFDKDAVPAAATAVKGSKRPSDAALLYRNHFTCFSPRLEPAPEKSQAEINAKVEEIKARSAR